MAKKVCSGVVAKNYDREVNMKKPKKRKVTKKGYDIRKIVPSESAKVAIDKFKKNRTLNQEPPNGLWDKLKRV